MMDTDKYQREETITGDSPEDTRLLREMAKSGRSYLAGFGWSSPVQGMFLTYGIGGVVAVFLAELSRPINRRDKYLWVVVGDLPSAYMVVDDIANPAEALQAYCDLMEDWIDAVKSGKNLSNVFPVQTEPTQENAQRLRDRIEFLRGQIIANIPQGQQG